jgi:hypothetical protein
MKRFNGRDGRDGIIVSSVITIGWPYHKNPANSFNSHGVCNILLRATFNGPPALINCLRQALILSSFS